MRGVVLECVDWTPLRTNLTEGGYLMGLAPPTVDDTTPGGDLNFAP